MAYLKFNKAELVNLEQSLKKELIVTNRTGAYANTTIVCCNTRKYHCLLAVPIEQMNWHRHILLSTLDETLVEHDKKFNLGIHNYGEVFEPRGHKYVVDYSNDPVPTITYNVGDIVIRKEILMVKNEDRVLIRYTLLDSNADITLRLQPYLAFRSIHELTHCNITADTRYTEIKNGKAFKLYSALPSLNMQVSKKTDYVANPDWYFGVNYPEERRRGFDYQEDLFVPGFFEMSMKKGESIIFSAGVEAADPATFKRKFTTEMNMMGVNEDYLSTLKNAASHLFFERGKRLEICTGFSWLGVGLLRDTCIIASGLTIFNDNDVKSFLRVFSDIIDKWKDDLVISTTQVEAPLRLASLMQDYNEHTNEEKQLWNKFGKIIKSILDSYITGRPEVKMHDNGLLWAHMPGVSLSWMNTYSDGHPNTERAGYQVETNALWYNALRYAEEMESKYATNKGLADKYGRIADRVAISFNDVFWNEERGMLAD
ncbi:MAG: glycogen debranching enzyme N-terminal domain-containing protein, partial [Bacteroidales bacterium]|nr:glycogen debranching enzyme N-terminal domain-containing protein [Bacteroidales bacterium]